MSKKAVIIGAGLSGLTAAAHLARDGFAVTVLEKHDTPGGVARKKEAAGFTFDMGPTWYLMPEVFDQFFESFGKRISDLYELNLLDPSYKIFFSPDDTATITGDMDHNRELFESLEPGGGEKLLRYLETAEYKYTTAMEEFLYREYASILDFFNKKMLLEGTRLHVFQKLDNYAKRFFKNPKSRKILEYNIVFLGCSPYKSPALYSLMSHVDIRQGVRHPTGGIYRLVESVYGLDRELGVEFRFGEEAREIIVENGTSAGVRTDNGRYDADVVLSAADYHHTETDLLEKKYRNYRDGYWKKKVYAPSGLIVYLGINKRLPALEHHNLFLSENWDEHFRDIFDRPAWPEDPSYYVGCPSRTDPTAAPPGCENLFILVPVAPGLNDTDEIRNRLTDKILSHLERLTGESIRDSVLYRETRSIRDFEQGGNLYRGTALGLAHTLFQTAVFRPSHRNRRVKNLFYSSHYTHPGIGMPMVFISSEIAAGIIRKEFA